MKLELTVVILYVVACRICGGSLNDGRSVVGGAPLDEEACIPRRDAIILARSW